MEYKINTRTYINALKLQLSKSKNIALNEKIKLKLKSIPFSDVTSWLYIEPNKEEELLSFQYNNKYIFVPFCNVDDVFMTLKDLNTNNTIYSFSTLNFTESALIEGVDTLSENDLKEIAELENFGNNLMKSNHINLENADLFCKMVCDWGRQNRVYANIKRLSPNNYKELLANWLNFVKNNQLSKSREIKQVSKMGDDIPGLGISFVSKHLRMLKPDVFPVLDDVLSQGLGFALNENGYVLFINSLNNFVKNNKDLFSHKKMNISQIELSLFLMCRQLVRSE